MFIKINMRSLLVTTVKIIISMEDEHEGYPFETPIVVIVNSSIYVKVRDFVN